MSRSKEEINYPYFKTSEQKELLNYLRGREFARKELFLKAFDEGLSESDIERHFPTPRKLPNPRKDLVSSSEAMREEIRNYFKREI